MNDRVKTFYAAHKTGVSVFAVTATAVITYKLGQSHARGKFEVIKVETFLNELTGDVHVKMWPKNGYATMPKTKPTLYT